MALSTYTELSNAVENYDPGIAARFADIPFDTLLAEFEADLQPTIKSRRASKTLIITSTGNTVALPVDFIEARYLNIGGVPLRPMSIYGGNREYGEIGYVMDGDNITLLRDDSADVDVELTYYARFAGLSVGNPSNYVLTYFPTVYLHGVLARVFGWLENANQEGAARGRFQQALGTIAADEARYQQGGNQITIGDVASW